MYYIGNTLSVMGCLTFMPAIHFYYCKTKIDMGYSYMDSHVSVSTKLFFCLFICSQFALSTIVGY